MNIKMQKNESSVYTIYPVPPRLKVVAGTVRLGGLSRFVINKAKKK